MGFENWSIQPYSITPLLTFPPVYTQETKPNIVDTCQIVCITILQKIFLFSQNCFLVTYLSIHDIYYLL